MDVSIANVRNPNPTGLSKKGLAPAIETRGWASIMKNQNQGLRQAMRTWLCHLSAQLCSPPWVGLCLGLHMEATAAPASCPPRFRTSKSFYRWFKLKPWDLAWLKGPIPGQPLARAVKWDDPLCCIHWPPSPPDVGWDGGGGMLPKGKSEVFYH